MPPISDLAEPGLSDSEYARRFIEYLDARIVRLTDELRDVTELRQRVAEWQARMEVSDADRPI
jgi:hypothetical protein